MGACERCGEDVEAGRLCVPCFTITYGPPPSTEPTWEVEHAMRKVRAQRLEEERRTGRRTHTLGDGWQQRPGVNAFDRGHGLGYR